MEVLALMKGDLMKVPNLTARCQTFLKTLIGNKQADQFFKEASQKICDVLIVPDELISEDFFAIDCAEEIILEHLPKLINSVLTFRGDDAAFAELIKDRVTDLVSVLVIELESGFGNYADA
jgi:hypothetical protein